MQATGDERQRVRQAGEDTEFARHIEGAGGQVPHRRAAQDGRLAIEVDQVVQVRQPAGELARRRFGIQVMAVRGQVGVDGTPVEGNALGG